MRCLKGGAHIGLEVVVLLVSRQYFSVRPEKYYTRYTRNAVDICRYGLAVEPAFPRQVVVFDCLAGVVRFIPYSHTKHAQALILKLVVQVFDDGCLTYARSAPTGPEVHQDIPLRVLQRHSDDG